MTRYTFGGEASDFAILDPALFADDVIAAPNRSGTAWSDITAGTQYTDLIAIEGASPPSTNGSGWINRFQGPDTITQMWVQFTGTGDRFLIRATDGPLGTGGGGLTLTETDNGDGTITLHASSTGGGGGGSSSLTETDNGDGTITLHAS